MLFAARDLWNVAQCKWPVEQMIELKWNLKPKNTNKQKKNNNKSNMLSNKRKSVVWLCLMQFTDLHKCTVTQKAKRSTETRKRDGIKTKRLITTENMHRFYLYKTNGGRRSIDRWWPTYTCRRNGRKKAKENKLYFHNVQWRTLFTNRADNGSTEPNICSSMVP